MNAPPPNFVTVGTIGGAPLAIDLGQGFSPAVGKSITLSATLILNAVPGFPMQPGLVGAASPSSAGTYPPGTVLTVFAPVYAAINAAGGGS